MTRTLQERLALPSGAGKVRHPDHVAISETATEAFRALVRDHNRGCGSTMPSSHLIGLAVGGMATGT
jgi:hypothetical protein